MMAKQWKVRACILVLLFCALVAGPGGKLSARQADRPRSVVSVDPAAYGMFTKMVDCQGIAIRGSSAVKDTSLLIVCGKLRRMLSTLPTMRNNLAVEGAEVRVAASGQPLTTLPGYLGDTTPYPAGAVLGQLFVSCPESDLLALQRSDPNALDTCTIAIAQLIFEAGFGPSVRADITKQLATSLHSGLWQGVVREKAAHIYWDQLSVWYFGGKGTSPADQQLASGPNALKSYDPKGFALLDRFYKGERQPGEITMLTLAKHGASDSLRTALGPDVQTVFQNDTTANLIIARFYTEPGEDPFDYSAAGRQDKEIFEMKPLTRRVLPCTRNDIWVVVSPQGKELGKWLPNGETSYIHLTSLNAD